MKTISTFILACTYLAGYAQTTISGRVTEKSGDPLLGVSIYVKGSYDGATSDIDGNFLFTTYEEDSLVLVASFIGFRKQEIPLTETPQDLSIVLKEEISQLNAVVITAGSFDASDENKREVLKPLDIATTAGATADIPGALNTLPGTQTVGETGRLFVRGGDGRETKTFIDGMLVHNEYSPAAPNTPSRSRFSPFMFKGMSFSTGGYSAEYGQALSSALILQTKEMQENDRYDISLMSVGADISAVKSYGKNSFAGKIGYTNLTPYFQLAPQNLKWDKAPEQMDGNFMYSYQTSKTGTLKIYSNLSRARMQLYEADIADPSLEHPVTVSNDYAHVNANYKEVLSDQVGIRGGVSMTRSSDVAALGFSARTEDLQGYHVKMVVDYLPTDRVGLIAGAEWIGTDIEQQLKDETSSMESQLDEQVSATFLEAEAFASSALAFKAGLRLENQSLSGDYTVAPRISSAYKTGEKSQVSLAYGIFYQAPASQVLLFEPHSRNERADHYIANYQWLGEGRSFRIEAYEKRYRRLIKYDDLFDPTSYSNSGDGFARGIDVFWRDSRSIKNLDYWVSYSYLNTERDYQDFPGAFVPSFASAHNFSVVTKKFFEEIKSQIGVTYSFASGRPYHNPNNSEFMSGRTPAYHDLSFNVSYLASPQIIVHAMVNNVLGINNVFGYEYANAPDADGIYAGRAITPPAPRFVFIGVFITLSDNKGINQLPSL